MRLRKLSAFFHVLPIALAVPARRVQHRPSGFTGKEEPMFVRQRLRSSGSQWSNPRLENTFREAMPPRRAHVAQPSLSFHSRFFYRRAGVGKFAENPSWH